MLNERQILGQTGEELAADYLMKNGYRIMHRNWNLHRGCELDIVAFKDKKLHFVEVKTRHKCYNMIGGKPEEAVNYQKMQHICRAINYYMSYFHYSCDFVIDVVGIVYRSDDDFDLNFLEDIRVPMGHVYYSNTGKRYHR